MGRARWGARARDAAIRAAQATQRPEAGAVYLNSFQGRYSDNPRAVGEELRRRGGTTLVWRSSVSGAEGFPPEVTAVPGGTWGHVRALGRASHVVTNDWMTSHRKRTGQVWLQTWHGTPLKRLALDRGLSADQVRSVGAEAGKWDYLVSQNAFSTEIFRRAFGYEGPVLETGYPRNDVLSSPAAGEIRRRVRRALGVSDQTTAVLYAPTFRASLLDRNEPTGWELPLEVAGATARLGQGHTLLMRLHHLVAPRFADVEGPSCINVSRHPDISELYLAADVLVTDYSSAMFDFAVTGKPIVFLTPDLEQYRDDERGFYFDFEAEAPGPIVRQPRALAEALSEPAAATAPHQAAYDAFRERYCALEDGHAARRVVDAVFAERER